jgi:cardiolipin synthase
MLWREFTAAHLHLDGRARRRYKPAMPEPLTTAFRWLRSGDAAFPAMLAAIDAARESVRLEMYIFTASPLAGRFREALVSAARRGVRVRVLLDAVGSFALPKRYWDPLRAAGGECRWFNPLAFGRMLYRDHRKMLVCDERTAFIGGLNIAPEYEGDGVTRGWSDLGMAADGALARELAEAFDGLFERADAPERVLQRLRKAIARKTASADNWRLLLSGPGRGYNFLKRTLATDLANAREVRIVSAYFLPTWRLRRELEGVVRRGGRAQLVLAGKSDVALSQRASHRLYAPLMKRGVEIYEYQPQVLHAKLFLIDEQVYVGSANLDARSLNINYELLVRISEPTVWCEAGEIFDHMLRHSRRIDAETWRASRSLWTRLLEKWAYFVLARVDPYLARLNLWRLKG